MRAFPRKGPADGNRWCPPADAARERGSAAVELVLATPVLVALMLLAVAGGRLASARGEVDAAARDAARAASIGRTPTGSPARTPLPGTQLPDQGDNSSSTWRGMGFQRRRSTP